MLWGFFISWTSQGFCILEVAIVDFAKAHAVGPDQMVQQALRHFGNGYFICRNKLRLAYVRAQLDFTILVDRDTLGPIGQHYTHHDKERDSGKNDSNYHSDTTTGRHPMKRSGIGMPLGTAEKRRGLEGRSPSPAEKQESQSVIDWLSAS